MISVVIPARNAESTIASTLESLAPDKALIEEILLVDDGSTDGTAAAAEGVAQRLGLPLRTLRVALASPGASRNAGLAEARGEHIFYLDADDQVVAGGLGHLQQALLRHPDAGLAVGASIHRSSRGAKLRPASRYSSDPMTNARRYLENKLRSITMGSALVSRSATAGVRFPERTRLDEDTCYWAGVLTKARVVTIEAPVLAYNIDETRMTKRFVTEPRKVLLCLSRELDMLAQHGIDRRVLQRRKAWIALRIARQLILEGRYGEAAGMMRAARGRLRWSERPKAWQYAARIRRGLAADSGRSSAAVTTPPSPRTLVLTVDPAWPAVSGADLRNLQNASAAASFGATMLVSLNPQSDPAPPCEGLTVASLSAASARRGRSLKSRSAAIEARLSQAMLERLRAIIKTFRPDVVLLEGIPLFQMLEHVRPLAPLLILDMHNVESDLARQTIGRRQRHWLSGLLGGSGEAARIRRLEQRAIAVVDRIWVCSVLDRRRLEDMFDVKVPVDVVPNGLPRAEALPAALRELPGRAQGYPVIVFVGHLGYAPNVDAAERLAMRILPLVQASYGEARLLLAGRDPAARVAALGSVAGVEVVANPPRLADVYERGHLSVVPLSAGGGTRIKILEAMAWGLPVVATPLAAEGHGFSDHIEIVLAERDEDLAQEIIALCLDRDRMESQRSRARDRVTADLGDLAIRAAVRSGLGMDHA